LARERVDRMPRGFFDGLLLAILAGIPRNC